MSSIIAQSGVPAHLHPDEAARRRQERLARATALQAATALAYLSAVDPLAFEMAMDAADQIADAPPEREEPAPACRRCGAQAGIFLKHGRDWQHFRGDGTTIGAQEVYGPGHPVEVTWRLPGEHPQRP